MYKSILTTQKPHKVGLVWHQQHHFKASYSHDNLIPNIGVVELLKGSEDAVWNSHDAFAINKILTNI